MSRTNTQVIAEMRAKLNEIQEAQTILCERLDEIVGGNTLLAVVEGTLVRKLSLRTIEHGDWDLISISGYVSEHAYTSENRSLMLSELYRVLYGILQCFNFCRMEIVDTWVLDMHFLGFSQQLEEFPLTEFSHYFVNAALRKEMPIEAVFAFVEYMCNGNLGARH